MKGSSSRFVVVDPGAIWGAVKAEDLRNAARRLVPRLTPDSLAVSMQNGICIDALPEAVGRERPVECVVGWGSTLHGPADMEITSSDEIMIGSLKDQRDNRMPFLQKAFDGLFPTPVVRDIYAHLYPKLIVNSCITSLGPSRDSFWET